MHGVYDRLRERRKRSGCGRLVRRINALEDPTRGLSDGGLAARVRELKKRRRDGAPLAGLCAEMFAIVREATRRALGIRQFDVQVAAAVALCGQNVIEMDTGEGKTFVAPLAAALYALDGRGVHVLTANDYLVERDARLLGPVYDLLGLRVGHVLCDTPASECGNAYRADITYTTVTRLGHDFLREYLLQAPDSLRQADMWQYLRSEIDGQDREQRCLRGRHFAIIDEVDSVLIDYARRPISIAQPAASQRDPELYSVCRRCAREDLAEREDYSLDNIRRRAILTDRGKRKVQELAGEHAYLHLMEAEWQERVEEALAAEYLLRRGEHYVVREGRAELVDQVSGRLMLGQRLGGEFHQALEAKENVPIQPRQEVVKRVTVQSLIRSYKNLAGMTATAWEARDEFHSVYEMNIVRFPPRTHVRQDWRPDVFFRQPEDRLRAVAEEVKELHRLGRPVLVGTWAVAESRDLSDLLNRAGVPHEVLNAVDHKNEAGIIARAGEKGRVTVAANMAGRGVEIPLGEGVKELGGLCVVGAGRHVLARADKQLAGRCARRGAPGRTGFYTSLEDDIFKVLPDRRRKRLLRKYDGMGSGARTSKELSGLVRWCQEQFRRRYAAIRRMLLVRDIAVEEAEDILFGQDRL